jgi:2,3,4,5-tetrahydropyridine-2-carboxylate N-succinyltransferase
MTQQLQTIIDTAWEQRADISPASASAEVRDAVAHVLAGLDDGSLRVAQKDTGSWVVNQWIKKAVLLSFRLENNTPVEGGGMQFYDKVPT